MKKFVFVITVCAFIGAIMSNLYSCKARESDPPVIIFDTVAGYVYEDTALPPNTIFPIWVTATKNGINDLVESGQISRSINGSPDSVLQTMNFVTTQFSYTYNYIAGSTPGEKDKYVFTFGNQNGATASDSVIITVN